MRVCGLLRTGKNTCVARVGFILLTVTLYPSHSYFCKIKSYPQSYPHLNEVPPFNEGYFNQCRETRTMESTTQNQTATELSNTLYELNRLTTLIEVIYNLAHDEHSVKALAAEAIHIIKEAAEELHEPLTYQPHECTIRAVGE